MEILSIKEAEKLGLHSNGMYYCLICNAEAEYNRKVEAYPKAKIVLVDTLKEFTLYVDGVYDLCCKIDNYKRQIEYCHDNIIEAKEEYNKIEKENIDTMSVYEKKMKELIIKLNEVE
jgi:hypothetical protein